MSIPAYFIDPRIVDLNNLNYAAWSVVAYQRTTVILTELVLGAAVLRCCSTEKCSHAIAERTIDLFEVLLIQQHRELYLRLSFFTLAFSSSTTSTSSTTASCSESCCGPSSWRVT